MNPIMRGTHVPLAPRLAKPEVPEGKAREDPRAPAGGIALNSRSLCHARQITPRERPPIPTRAEMPGPEGSGVVGPQIFHVVEPKILYWCVRRMATRGPIRFRRKTEEALTASACWPHPCERTQT